MVLNAKESLIEKYKEEIDPNSEQRSATYVAMAPSMMRLALLDEIERGIADKTVIILSDNGGNIHTRLPEGGGIPVHRTLPRGGKASMRGWVLCLPSSSARSDHAWQPQ